MTTELNTPDIGTAALQTALDSGDWERAWELIVPRIEEETDEQLLGIAALIARARGDFDSAITLTSTLQQQHPDSLDFLHNLALLSFEQQDYRTAFRHFRTLARAGEAGARADQAVSLLELGKKRRAIVLLRHALKEAPADPAIRKRVSDLCMEHELALGSDMPAVAASGTKSETTVLAGQCEHVQGKRILFLAQHQMFLGDIVARLSKKNKITVSDEQRPEQLRQLMQQADLVWLEWCDQTAITVSKLPKTCPIVCRLHSYELFSDWPSQVNWTAIDHLVFVSTAVQELVARWHRVSVPQTVILNGVDCARFTIPPGKTMNKRIASVGYINYKKNPALLLHAFHAIHDYDPAYTLHIAGEHQDPRLVLYLEHYLRRHPLPVHFDGWVKDMPAWYADKSYVISTSLFESFHYSIAEGMASGLLPLVHDWFGADRLYPEQALFALPHDCRDLIKRYEQSDVTQLRQDFRTWIINRYNAEEKTLQIETLLGRILRSHENGTRV